MSLYRLYIDEVGNHDLTHADEPNHRFLSLTGVIVESGYASRVLIPEMDALKRHFFQQDPDEPVILHRKEMVNARPPFQRLRDPATRSQFDQELLSALERWEYNVITVVIDKKDHRDRYSVWKYQPYHYCLAVMLERYIISLEHSGDRGDVMVESRGGKEDEKLKESYTRLMDQGTSYVAVERWQQRFTTSEIKCKPKQANVAGLQLADLIAHPSRRELLLDNGLITDPRDTFGDQVCAVLRETKYSRSVRTGRIEGCGKKLLP